MRKFWLWTFGILASAIFGGLVGDYLSPHDFGWFWGTLGGGFAFACARLWLAEREKRLSP